MLSKIRKIRTYRRYFSQKEAKQFRVIKVTEPAKVRTSQRLHARVYVERKFIQSTDVGRDGRIKKSVDPYHSHSEYFAVLETGRKGKVVATSRQINVKGSKGHASFPTIEKLELYAGMREAIGHLDPKTCVEISGLAKLSGISSYASLLLYRKMWHWSLTQKHQLWVMACDAAFYKHLKFLFGDALVQIGPKTHYMGSYVIPAALEVEHSLDILVNSSKSLNPITRTFKRDMISFLLTGLPVRFLKPTRIRELNEMRLLEQTYD